MGKIYSPGKLMLTSEYFAVDGALVLAVATKPGQEFFFDETDDGQSLVYWEAYHQNKIWLQAKINYQTWSVVETNVPESAAFILKVLQNVQQLSDIQFKSNRSYHLKTNLQFPSNYGLGSSSTLMNNLAEWAQIDPFILNEKSLGGSGYDIAVAQSKSAVLYRNQPEVFYEKVNYRPPFADELIFIHLNLKQNSREGIALYRSKTKSEDLISYFSDLTKKILLCQELEKFSELMMQHEQKISHFVGIPTAKSLYFKDCPVFVKSLGAWGGDFIMTQKFPGYEDYFRGRGFSKIGRAHV